MKNQMDKNVFINQPIGTIWEKPDFNWENKNLWINNPMAVKYWMANGNSIHKYNKLCKDHLKELDNIDSITKTY